MTLEDKIYQTLVNNPDTYPVQQCEQVADEFAIEFGQWLLNQPYRVKYNDKKELLEIYKKEKGL
ncbi:MAG: hypothetical protein JHC33_12770 [Ignisphaera sp.]|nr:hypothetical protein [Ignisphaera sp.]